MITRVIKNSEYPRVLGCTLLSIEQNTILARKLRASATLPLSGTVCITIQTNGVKIVLSNAVNLLVKHYTVATV